VIDCVSIDIGEDLVPQLGGKTEQWRVSGIGNAAKHSVSYVCSYQDEELTLVRVDRDCEERLAEYAEQDRLDREKLQPELQPDPGVPCGLRP